MGKARLPTFIDGEDVVIAMTTRSQHLQHVDRSFDRRTFSYLTILVTKLRGLRSSEMGIRTLRTQTLGNTLSICSPERPKPRQQQAGGQQVTRCSDARPHRDPRKKVGNRQKLRHVSNDYD